MGDTGAMDDDASGGRRGVDCPHCGASIDGRRARRSGPLWRLGCPACGLQLVRRPGSDWTGIRG